MYFKKILITTLFSLALLHAQSGIGLNINDEDIDRVFDLDYKDSQSEGSGMGLYLSKRIIKRIGGEIYIEKNIPKGIVVTLCLNKYCEEKEKGF